ncbi:YdcF family protein [soil metagenome]
MREIAGIDDLVEFGRGADGRRPPRRRRGWRWFRRTVLLVVLAAVGYYGITLVQVWSTGRTDQTRAVDAIVVLGAAQYDGHPSPQLAARLDHVVDLYADEWAPVVVVTGGKQPGDRFTESEASSRYLTDRGVPPSAIVMEVEGRTTFETLESVAAMLDERGLGRVLLVTDPYHSLRSRLIAQHFGLEAYVSPTPTSVVQGAHEVRRMFLEAGGIAVGRLIGYDHI